MKVLKRCAALLLSISLCVLLVQAQSVSENQQASKTLARDVLIIIQREQVRFHNIENPRLCDESDECGEGTRRDHWQGDDQSEKGQRVSARTGRASVMNQLANQKE